MLRRTLLSLGLAATFLSPASAAPDESLKNEVQAAIGKGVGFLKSKQDPATGSFGDPAYPAMTALSVICIMGDPDVPSGTIPPEVRKACDWLVSLQKPDGGIHQGKLPNYNSSLSLTALTTVATDPKYREAAIKARRAVISGQHDGGEKGKQDDPSDGGIGYGSSPVADMSNTHYALEALYNAQRLLQDDPDAAKNEPKLNYSAAIDFVSRCQNLPATNKEGWASDDEKNKGGFVYRPGDSKAGTDDLGNGKTALRSYASISYAGMLSFIYADMKPDDERVKAVKEWLGKNYSLTENPGMGQEGLFYYYHTMAKALNLSRMNTVELPGGKQANWRLDLSKQLFNLQKPDGSFANENGRWMEKDPVLATCYAVLALNHTIRGL